MHSNFPLLILPSYIFFLFQICDTLIFPYCALNFSPFVPSQVLTYFIDLKMSKLPKRSFEFPQTLHQPKTANTKSND